MDQERFDAFARALAGGRTRRSLLTALVAGAAGVDWDVDGHVIDGRGAGGGGGGYYGGGGGGGRMQYGGGGGGGSGFIHPFGSAGSFQTGVREGDGLITVRYWFA